MKLWLDDVRKPPDDSYLWVKSVEDALKAVREMLFEEWALDHDLGGQLAHYGKGPYDYHAKTGTDFLTMTQWSNMELPQRISIHSTNSMGTAAMVATIHNIATGRGQNIEIVVRPLLGRIMDKTPYYEDR